MKNLGSLLMVSKKCQSPKLSDLPKEIYLSNLEWTKTHDNMGGVMGNVIFKDNMSYEEYNKLFKSGYFVLCNKDYITNLQEELKSANESISWWQNRFNAVEKENEKALKENEKALKEKKILEKLDWNKNDFTYPEGNLMSEETADMLMEIQDKVNFILEYFKSKEE